MIANLPNGWNTYSDQQSGGNLGLSIDRPTEPGISAGQAAQMLNVGSATVSRAKGAHRTRVLNKECLQLLTHGVLQAFI